jgi:integrase
MKQARLAPMASIDDRWYRRQGGRLVPTARHGRGMRWRVRYLDPSGRERGKSFARKQDAEKFKATTEADLIRGQWADPDAGRRLLADYAREWLASRSGEPSTLQVLRVRVERHIIPGLGSMRLADIKASRVTAFMAGLRTATKDATPLAPGTARGVFTTLSAILAAAVDDELIPSNPCRKASVKAPKLVRRKVIPWTGAQVGAVRAGLPERWRVFCDLGAGLGMRQGEILGLDLGLVEMLPHVVHVRQQLRIVAGRLVLAPPKGGRDRDVPVPEPVAQAIAAHLAMFPAREVALPWRTPAGPKRTAWLLLVTAVGEPVRRDSFNHVWRQAVRSAGMTPHRDTTGTHQLRHRYASMLLAGGVDVRTLAEHLGHSDASITLRTYSHLLPNAADRARRAIEDALAADGPGRDQEAENQ